MRDTIFAIPSYKRGAAEGTAEYLRSIGIDRSRIYIFVQTMEDLEEYEKNKQGVHIILKQSDNVVKARNNILDYFYSEEKAPDVLMMDDDVKHIVRLGRGPIQTAEELDAELYKAFGFAKKNGGSLIGIYPVANEYFMSEDISTIATVNTVIGFAGNSQMKHIRFDESFQTKEDMELCARLLTMGKRVFRFNYLGVEAKHRTNSGGCYDLWKSRANDISVRKLLMKYPNLFAKNTKRQGEVRIKVRDRKIKHGK